MFRIGEFAVREGVSVDTLRYYEKLGLLRPVRAAGGQRLYSERDGSWLRFVLRLRGTGMPLAEIQRYSLLREQGAGTLEERLSLLRAHRSRLAAQIAALEEQMEHLDGKIS